jgi:hypothetical protein
MSEFKLKIQEKVSAWRELEMIVEAPDLATLKKQIERDSLDIIDVQEVHYFDETTDHIEYDMEYCEIYDEQGNELLEEAI